MTDETTSHRLAAFREALSRYRKAAVALDVEPSSTAMDAVQKAGLSLVNLFKEASIGTPLTRVLREVEAERCAQVVAGYDAAHDDGHALGEIGFAAGLFVLGPLLKLEVDEDSVATLDKAAEIRRSAS